jgi:hypothetical protein
MRRVEGSGNGKFWSQEGRKSKVAGVREWCLEALSAEKSVFPYAGLTVLVETWARISSPIS